MEEPRTVILLPRGVYLIAGVLAGAYLLYWLRGVLTPIFLAFAIAYLLDPVVDRFEALRLPRAVGIAVVMLGALTLLVLVVLLVVPRLVADVAGVLRDLPAHAQTLLERTQGWLGRMGIQTPTTSSEWVQRLREHADKIAGTVVAPVGTALGWVVGGTATAIGAAVGALIVPVLAIYLLYDFDRITAGIHDLIPLRYREPVTSYAREIDEVLGQFVRGQLLVMVILAVLYGGSYAALGIRLAIPIGIVAGILNFVPYLGSAFALGAGIVMSVIGGGGWGQLAGVAIAYAVVQSLEGFVITPRIVGKTVGLRDVWVLLAMFVGGELFGFLGVLLALPGAAVAKIFVTRAIARYRGSSLFLAAPGTTPPGEGGGGR